MDARILVVEDNANNLELMCYLLNAFGYTTIFARDGLEGVEVAHREVPALILLDIQMPKLDGYAVVRLLKSDPAFASIPIIAITALAMVGDRDRILAAGFDGYLSKPIDPETFRDEVQRFLLPKP
jgi:CheY-like chemotaxis protein